MNQTPTPPDRHDNDHWLVRPATIRKLWIGLGIVLALTVLAQALVPIKGYFGADDWFGFAALFGFGSCVAMVVIAKLLGVVVKRDERYYDD
ncbi:MAG: hypothetical protein QNJ73_03545 [Gammaproteobacteria bacterium]|nr:hypothetical protein [Gammaproteobacteria bacterium]